MQSNLEIQHNLYQNSIIFFCKKGKAHPQIQMELQGAQNSQNNLEKEKQNQNTHTFSF